MADRETPMPREIIQAIGSLLDEAHADVAKRLLTFAKAHYHDFGSLSVEQANLLGALGWTLHQQDWARFVEYALVLDAYLDTQGDWEQDRLILGLALQACDALGGEYAGRAAVLQHNLAVIDMAQGRLAQAETRFQLSLTVQHRLGDALAMSRALHYLGRIRSHAGDHAQARQRFEESLALAQQIHDTRGMAATLHEMGNVDLAEGALSQAEANYRRSLGMSEDGGDARDSGSTLHQLGILQYRQGALERAQAYYEGALRLWRGVGYREGIAKALFALGQLASDRGDKVEADSLWCESLALFEDIGAPEADAARDRLSALHSRLVMSP
jgi:tetratricopeptide (TPR) repeat protein